MRWDFFSLPGSGGECPRIGFDVEIGWAKPLSQKEFEALVGKSNGSAGDGSGNADELFGADDLAPGLEGFPDAPPEFGIDGAGFDTEDFGF